MNSKEITKAAVVWNQAKKHLQSLDPHLDKDDLEAERQDILKLSGAKADSNGRYSVKTLTSTGLDKFLDLCETTLGGKPNQRRQSKTLKWCINQLKMPGITDRDAYINAIAQDRFHTDDWTTLEIKDLRFLLWTLKARLRARTKRQNPATK